MSLMSSIPLFDCNSGHLRIQHQSSTAYHAIIFQRSSSRLLDMHRLRHPSHVCDPLKSVSRCLSLYPVPFYQSLDAIILEKGFVFLFLFPETYLSRTVLHNTSCIPAFFRCVERLIATMLQTNGIGYSSMQFNQMQ